MLCQTENSPPVDRVHSVSGLSNLKIPSSTVHNAMSTPAATSPIFNAQERVLCYHGPLIYEAKVLKTKTFEEPNPNPATGKVGPHYLVHYKGWKQTCVLFLWQTV